MALFGQRSVGYQLGLVTIILCCLLHLIGYSSPYWTTADDGTSSANQGLWMLCVSTPSLSTCVSLGFTAVQAWFHIVRLMESVGLGLLFGASIYGLVVNCSNKIPKYGRNLEAFALVGGLLAFIGAMVFVGQAETTEVGKDLRKMGWAFFLTAIGSGLAVLASIVVFATNKPLDAQTTGPVGMTNVGGYPSTVVVQSGSSSATAPPYGGPYSVAAPQAGYGPYSAAAPQAGYPYKS